ncbi:MAG: hypothetical protein MJ208_03600 [Bacilli bacterium]|nr:hypothetical protein [Bacilli bacterium]
MAKRIVAMFSMLVAAVAILLSSDLVSSQMIYSELDTMSTTVGYYISKEGGVTEEIKTYVKKEINASIYCAMEECTAIKKGDTYFYIIEKEYAPILFRQKGNSIQVKRSVVIGLYS